MKQKTTKEIDCEVRALKRMKPLIPKRTMFGDDNIAKIDAEIRTLDEQLDEEDIDREFYVDETAEEFRDSDLEPWRAAQYAFRWKCGEEDESPSEGWKPLVEKAKKQ